MPSNRNIPDSCVPGPGTYDSIRPIGIDKQKFSFGPRTLFNDPAHIEKKKGVPGPGQYEDKLTTHRLGKYFVSTYL